MDMKKKRVLTLAMHCLCASAAILGGACYPVLVSQMGATLGGCSVLAGEMMCLVGVTVNHNSYRKEVKRQKQQELNVETKQCTSNKQNNLNNEQEL